MHHHHKPPQPGTQPAKVPGVAPSSGRPLVPNGGTHGGSL